MTALAMDVRELSLDELNLVSGGDFWGQAQGAGMIVGGLVGAAVASASVPATAGASSMPAYFAVSASVALVVAGVEKMRES